jgi:hypothetical protein
MDRYLYLFFIRHVKEEVPCSDEEDRKSREHWAWLEKEVKALPVPARAYFDSVDYGFYPQLMGMIQSWIKDFYPLKNLAPQLRMMVRLRKAGVTIEPTEDTRLLRNTVLI